MVNSTAFKQYQPGAFDNPLANSASSYGHSLGYKRKEEQPPPHIERSHEHLPKFNRSSQPVTTSDFDFSSLPEVNEPEWDEQEKPPIYQRHPIPVPLSFTPGFCTSHSSVNTELQRDPLGFDPNTHGSLDAFVRSQEFVDQFQACTDSIQRYVETMNVSDRQKQKYRQELGYLRQQTSGDLHENDQIEPFALAGEVMRSLKLCVEAVESAEVSENGKADVVAGLLGQLNVCGPGVKTRVIEAGINAQKNLNSTLGDTCTDIKKRLTRAILIEELSRQGLPNNLHQVNAVLEDLHQALGLEAPPTDPYAASFKVSQDQLIEILKKTLELVTPKEVSDALIDQCREALRPVYEEAERNDPDPGAGLSSVKFHELLDTNRMGDQQAAYGINSRVFFVTEEDADYGKERYQLAEFNPLELQLEAYRALQNGGILEEQVPNLVVENEEEKSKILQLGELVYKLRGGMPEPLTTEMLKKIDSQTLSQEMRVCCRDFVIKTSSPSELVEMPMAWLQEPGSLGRLFDRLGPTFTVSFIQSNTHAVHRYVDSRPEQAQNDFRRYLIRSGIPCSVACDIGLGYSRKNVSLQDIHAAVKGRNLDWLPYLKQSGADFSSYEKDTPPHSTAVYEAMRHGRVEDVQAMLRVGMKNPLPYFLKQSPEDWKTPNHIRMILSESARIGNTKVLLALVEAGLKPTLKHPGFFEKEPGHSIFYLPWTAAGYGQVEYLKFLLRDLRCDFNREKGIFSPINAAIRNGRLPAVQFLLEEGNVRVNEESCRSYTGGNQLITPLVLAAERGDLDVAALLLKAGAKVDRSAVRTAEKAGHHALVQLMSNFRGN